MEEKETIHTMRLLGILTEQQLIAAYLGAPQRTLAEEVDA